MSGSERPKAPAAPRRGIWRLVRWCWLIGYGLFGLLPVTLISVYQLAPVPITPLMVIRLVEGEGLTRTWVPLEAMGRAAPRSVIAAEDNFFCEHFGFDWEELNKVLDDVDDDRPRRGGSTITQQAAKNLFLWPDRSYIRKAIEAYLTILMELMLDKRRILELYLNVVEFGPGIYGIEAAAQHYFKKPAARLSAREAGLIAAILPNPRRLSADQPGPKTARKANTVSRRTEQLGPLYDCVPEIAWTTN
jgi:monofunctional biosynthetic peptidoglycan transglycosylase